MNNDTNTLAEVLLQCGRILAKEEDRSHELRIEIQMLEETIDDLRLREKQQAATAERLQARSDLQDQWQKRFHQSVAVLSKCDKIIQSITPGERSLLRTITKRKLNSLVIALKQGLKCEPITNQECGEASVAMKGIVDFAKLGPI